MSAFLAIAWNTFREARRNRVTMVVFAFAIVLLFSTTLLTEVTVHTFDRVVTDFGLGSMSLILVALALYLSCGVIPLEIERRTIFLVVTRPVSRSMFLVARLCGNMLTLAAVTAAMSGVFFLQLLLTRTPATQPMLAALVGLLAELAVLSAVGLLVSTFSSQLVSALISIGIYFAGHLAGDIYRVAAKSTSEVVQFLGKGTYYVVPNLERLNFKPMATYGVEVTATQLLSGLGMALAYTLVFTAGATLIFERRDFK